MNISKNNWIAIYYKWIYGELPDNSCSLIRGSFLIIVLFPVYVVGRLLVNPYEDKVFGAGFTFWAAYVVFLILGLGLTEKTGYEYTHWAGYLLLAPIIGAIFIISLIVIVGGPFALVMLTKEKVEYSDTYDKFNDWIGAIRKRHCTPIKWK